MTLEEITPAALKKAPDDELLSLHRRTHQWFANTKENGASIETIVNAHSFIVAEMEKRGMEHNVHPGLDQAKLPKQAANDVVVVPDYVSVVGSAAREGLAAAHDLDILIREDGDVPNYYRESLMLLLRRFFDPDKTGKELHLLFSPQGPHEGQYVPVFDLVLRTTTGEAKLVKAASLEKRRARFGPENRAPRFKSAGINPFDKYTAQKPSMKYYTDFVSVKELWDDWASKVVDKQGTVLVSPKVDGLRALIHCAGGRAMIYSEDAKQEYDVPSLMDTLRKCKTSMVVEGELQAVSGGKYVARPELISLLANKFEGATPVVFLYDMVYFDGADVHEQPFSERYALIKRAASTLGARFVALPQQEAKSEASLKSMANRLLNYGGPGGRDLPIEGVVTRDPNMPYSFGSTNDYAKTKRTVEIKARVLSVNKVANGYTYDCALREPSEGIPKGRVVDIDGKPYQKLGKTFVSPTQLAGEGDTLNVTVEEMILLSDGTLTWGKPTPQGPDRSRPAYTVQQAIDLARRYGALREEKMEPTQKSTIILCERCDDYHMASNDCDPNAELWSVPGVATRSRRRGMKVVDFEFVPQSLMFSLAKAGPHEEEGRAGEAAAYWKKSWFDALPRSGRGRFVYHHHWRGLTEDEAKGTSESTLLDTDHSVHGDLRLQGEDALWGFTTFLGKASEVKAAGGDRLQNLPTDDSLQGSWKLAQPTEWLNVGVGKPAISEPEEVGATSQAWAKFFVYDRGTYKLGVAREHMFEVFLSGSKVKGRYQITFAPMGGRRVWLVSKPESDTPYAEEHKLADVIKELRGKRQPHLVWSDGAHGPYFIDIPKSGDALLAALEVEDADQWKVLAGVVKKETEEMLAKAWETTENEIRHRVREPGDFEQDSFRRITIQATKPRVFAVIGKLKGEKTTTVQALRFPTDDEWTLTSAKKWVEEHPNIVKSDTVSKHHGGGNTLYRQVHGKWVWQIKGVPTVIPAFISYKPMAGSKTIELVVREAADREPEYWSPSLAQGIATLIAGSAGVVPAVKFDRRGDPEATPLFDLVLDENGPRLVKAADIKVTLLGTGGEQVESRISPYGLLVQVANKSFVFDGGPGLLEKLPKAVDAWFITNPYNTHLADIKEQAETLGVELCTGYDAGYSQDRVHVRPWGAYGRCAGEEGAVCFEIAVYDEKEEKRTTIIWGPLGPDRYMVEDADLVFAGAHGWKDTQYLPGGRALPSALDASRDLKSAGVKKLVLVNVDDDLLRNWNESELLFGEVGLDGQMFALAAGASHTDQAEVAKSGDTQPFEYTVLEKAAEEQYTFGVCYKATNMPRDPELDAHDEFIMADELQKGQWGYVQAGDRRIYLQHGAAGIIPVGEWVDIVAWPWEVTTKLTLPDGKSKETTIPANSVWMGVLWNDAGWRLVKSGQIRGLSMGGFAKRKPVVTTR
jgi:hypothetical protein